MALQYPIQFHYLPIIYTDVRSAHLVMKQISVFFEHTSKIFSIFCCYTFKQLFKSLSSLKLRISEKTLIKKKVACFVFKKFIIKIYLSKTSLAFYVTFHCIPHFAFRLKCQVFQVKSLQSIFNWRNEFFNLELKMNT